MTRIIQLMYCVLTLVVMASFFQPLAAIKDSDTAKVIYGVDYLAAWIVIGTALASFFWGLISVHSGCHSKMLHLFTSIAGTLGALTIIFGLLMHRRELVDTQSVFSFKPGFVMLSGGHLLWLTLSIFGLSQHDDKAFANIQENKPKINQLPA